MNGLSEYVSSAAVIGTGATAVMDLGAMALKAIWGIAPPNYGLVGRWVAYMMRGQFRHNPIAASRPIGGERVIGWATHYGIGVGFAGLLLAIWGLDWARHPIPGPALIVGLGTVVFPFLVMQPGMGAGVASRRAPNPSAARVRSLVNHGLFGLGLYVSGWLALLIGSL